MPSTHHLIPASRVDGTPVFNPAGEKLGTIADIMVDKVSGKVVYALMSFDGFLGIGERFFPLPWSVLAYDVEKRGYRVPLTRAQLESGHAVVDREIGDEIGWREAVHAYYGAAPYWIGVPLAY